MKKKVISKFHYICFSDLPLSVNPQFLQCWIKEEVAEDFKDHGSDIVLSKLAPWN